MIHFDENQKYANVNSSSSKFIFSLVLQRNYFDAVKMIFFPSCLLWALAYASLLIKVDDFTNRNRMSITVLLALVTLFGSTSIKQDFPTTTYFKYIDLWFTWYLTSIFLIIVHHTMIGRMIELAQETQNKTLPLRMDNLDVIKELNTNVARAETINRLALIIFLFSTVSFNAKLCP